MGVKIFSQLGQLVLKTGLGTLYDAQWRGCRCRIPPFKGHSAFCIQSDRTDRNAWKDQVHRQQRKGSPEPKGWSAVDDDALHDSRRSLEYRDQEVKTRRPARLNPRD